MPDQPKQLTKFQSVVIDIIILALVVIILAGMFRLFKWIVGW